MAREASPTARRDALASGDGAERSLLSADDDEDIIVHDGHTEPLPAGDDEGKSPRTPNRVRFELDDGRSNGHVQPADSSWADDEDYLAHNAAGSRRDSAGYRAPLLTDIEAPSVTVASAADDFDAQGLLESSRPKSDMRSAFMNMANSIM